MAEAREVTVHLPRDLEASREFGRLALALGEAGNGSAPLATLFVVWQLYRFLAQSVVVGRVGHMDISDQVLFCGRLPEAFREGIIRQLWEAQWLVECETGGWVCPLFQRDNAHLDPGALTIQQKGNRASNFNARLRTVQEKGPAQLALLPAEHFVIDGRALDHTEIGWVQLVINAFDGFTGRPLRKNESRDWPPDLIRSAWSVLEANNIGIAVDVARWLLTNNMHGRPGIPRTTEQCLEVFAQLRTVSGQ